MHKNMLELIAFLCSIRKQYQWHSTHVDYQHAEWHTIAPVQHVQPLLPATSLNQRPSPVAISFSKEPAVSWSSKRGESSFCAFFSSSKGGWGLKWLISLIKEQCEAFTLFNLKIKVSFHTLLLEEFKTEKIRCPLSTQLLESGRSQAKKENPSLEKLSRLQNVSHSRPEFYETESKKRGEGWKGEEGWGGEEGQKDFLLWNSQGNRTARLVSQGLTAFIHRGHSQEGSAPFGRGTQTSLSSTFSWLQHRYSGAVLFGLDFWKKQHTFSYKQCLYWWTNPLESSEKQMF